MALKKSKCGSLVGDVISQIEEEIAKGTLEVGEKLPNPQALQESFGVSRGTLREALKVLEQMGLIELRPGVRGGAVVRHVTIEPTTQSLALLIRHRRVSFHHIAQFRVEIEGIVASLAAKKATQKDKKRLHALVDEAREYFERGFSNWEDFIQIDEKFHLMLADITENPLFKVTLEAVHRNIHEYLKFFPWNDNIVSESYGDLRRILQAIENGNEKKACSYAQSHVRRFYKIMEAIFKESHLEASGKSLALS